MSVSVQVWWVGVVVPLGKEPLVGVLPLFGLCCILDTQCCLVLRPCDGDERRVCACVCVRACVHVLQIPQCPGGCGGKDVYGSHPAGQTTQIEHSVSPYPSSFLSRAGRAKKKGQQETEGTDHAMQCTTCSRNMPRSAGFPLSQIGAAHQFTVALAGFGVASARRRER